MVVEKLVRRFYLDLWNQKDHRIAHEIIAEDIRFRPSLDGETIGRRNFLAYVDRITMALEAYHCAIEDLIVDESANAAAARMLFSGVHRRPFFGFDPTGETVAWRGAAFFKVSRARISDAWILGDLDGLRRTLEANAQASADAQPSLDRQ